MYFTKIFKPIYCLVAILLIVSCEKESYIPENLIGTWTGVRSYNNPVSGIKFQYLYVTFDADHTGTLEYETPSGTGYASFNYNVSNDIINCNGVYCYIDGDVEENFYFELSIEGERIIPQNKFTQFILTKDGSVETDVNGNEVVDQSSLLQNVWIHKDRNVILDIKNDRMIEYILAAPNSKKYTYYYDNSLHYNFRSKILMIGTNAVDIIELNTNSLILKNDSEVFEYSLSSSDCIPTEPDIKSFLCYPFLIPWATKGDQNNFFFYKNGTVQYFQESNVMVGSWGHASLQATGTYSVENNLLYCQFTDVSWTGGDLNAYANIFPGWNYNQPCTKKYTIKIINNKKIELNGIEFTIDT